MESNDCYMKMHSELCGQARSQRSDNKKSSHQIHKVLLRLKKSASHIAALAHSLTLSPLTLEIS